MQEAISYPEVEREDTRLYPQVARSGRPLSANCTSIVHVWRETLHTLGGHSVPILACATVGFAGMSTLGAAISLLLYLDDSRASTNAGDGEYLRFLIPGAVGLIVASFAQGAISWIAL